MKTQNEFAVIYRGYLRPNCEADYLKSWHLIADYFVNQCGALGSTLHQAEDGMWVAYSKWPSRETRDTAWPKDNSAVNKQFPSTIQNAITTLKNCLDPDRLLPEICTHVILSVEKTND